MMKFLKDYPNFMKEFHTTKNKELIPENVRVVKSPKVWWKCLKGEDHEWEQSVSDRVKNKSKCPFCSNRKLSITNSLAKVRPDLAKEWHPTKNSSKTPHDYIFGTHKYVWWKCDNHHEWRTSIQFRTKGQSGCPDCAIEKFKLQRSDIEQGKAFSIKEAKEDILIFMNKYNQIPSTTENLTIRKIYFRLTKEILQSEGKIENWPHLITDCIKSLEDDRLKNKLTEDYQKLLYVNRKKEWQSYGLKFDNQKQLKTVRPDLIEELHPTLNYESIPEILHYESNTQIWWLCDHNHSFRMRISARTIEKHNCPICSFADLAVSPNVKPKYFWHTLFPAFYYAKKVITDYFVEHHKVPASMENKSIHTIYRALRNPKVQKIWKVDHWSELLRLTIGELDDSTGDLRDELIESYNLLALKLKHKGWLEIIV